MHKEVEQQINVSLSNNNNNNNNFKKGVQGSCPVAITMQ